MPYQIKTCHKCKKPKKKGTKKGTGLLLSQEYAKHGYDATMIYAQTVRQRFKKKPAVFRKFLNILSDVQKDGSNKIEIIKKLIVLLDGHPDLILGFNSFLPEEYSIELQADAAVIKVYEVEPPEPEFVSVPKSPKFRSRSSSRGRRLAGSQSFDYIRRVKEAYQRNPEVYEKFQVVLEDYHNRKVNEIDTVHEIVALFQRHSDLVLGFNQFLPEGFRIHMAKKGTYDIEYPQEGTMKGHMCIMLDDDF